LHGLHLHGNWCTTGTRVRRDLDGKSLHSSRTLEEMNALGTPGGALITRRTSARWPLLNAASRTTAVLLEYRLSARKDYIDIRVSAPPVRYSRPSVVGVMKESHPERPRRTSASIDEIERFIASRCGATPIIELRADSTTCRLADSSPTCAARLDESVSGSGGMMRPAAGQSPAGARSAPTDDTRGLLSSRIVGSRADAEHA